MWCEETDVLVGAIVGFCYDCEWSRGRVGWKFGYEEYSEKVVSLR